MVFKCYICSYVFSQKNNLNRHLSEYRCKSYLLKDLSKLNDKLKKMYMLTNDLLDISVNSINNLNIKSGDIKKLIISYDKYLKNRIQQKLNIILTNYIKDVIYNKLNPANHVVKYVKKKPPLYKLYIEDENGKIITNIYNYKDACEILIDPIINQLKLNIDSLKKTDNFDYELYENVISDFINNSLTKINIKKALKTVLQMILIDPEMKINQNAN